MKTTIIAPIITERSLALAKQGKFSFLVALDADKASIKKAIKDAFKVDVIGVDTIIQKGKTKRIGMKRVEKKLAKTKKAVVTLKSGQKIDIFDLGV